MNRKQKKLLCLISFVSITICILYMFAILNAPKITLNGDETIIINLYDKYEETGATAYINDNNLSDEISISDNIDVSQPGEYTVTYSLKNRKVKRKVIVKDNIPPNLSLKGSEKMIVKLNDIYIEPGAVAIDNVNGNISNSIEITTNVDTSKIGNYITTYKVEDAHGNSTIKIREVLVRENDTYVMVSIEKQKIEVYKKSELVITSPIVTGTENYTETDKGIFEIYYKSKNAYLQGRGYLTHVNYWMPYNKGEGLHDATWRDEFGGNIYKTNGSHGCVNMPLEVAKKIYDIVDVGTIVEVY